MALKENKQQSHPAGSVEALSTCALATLAIGFAFLGYYGYSSDENNAKPWSIYDLPVLLPVCISFFYLASVPYLITAPVDSMDLSEKTVIKARHWYKLGVTWFLIGVLISLVSGSTIFTSNTNQTSDTASKDGDKFSQAKK